MHSENSISKKKHFMRKKARIARRTTNTNFFISSISIMKIKSEVKNNNNEFLNLESRKLHYGKIHLLNRKLFVGKLSVSSLKMSFHYGSETC
jgi:hypothetical protein